MSRYFRARGFRGGYTSYPTQNVRFADNQWVEPVVYEQELVQYRGKRGNNRAPRNFRRGRGRGFARQNNYQRKIAPPQDIVLDNDLDFNLSYSLERNIMPLLPDYLTKRTTINVKASSFLKVTTDFIPADTLKLNVSNFLFRVKTLKNRTGRLKKLFICGILSVHEPINGVTNYRIADITDYKFGKNPQLIKYEYANGVKKIVKAPIDNFRAFSILQAVNNATGILVNPKTHEINEILIAESTMPYVILEPPPSDGNAISDAGIKTNSKAKIDLSKRSDATQMAEGVDYTVSNEYLTSLGTVTILPSRTPKRVRFLNRTNRCTYLWNANIPMPPPGTNGKFVISNSVFMFALMDTCWNPDSISILTNTFLRCQNISGSSNTSESLSKGANDFVVGSSEYHLTDDENN